jgi:hypothetical protein
VDRHEIWRRVRWDWERANEGRANGFVPVVHAWIAGRPEPIELGYVMTRQQSDDVWIRIETPGPVGSDGKGAIPPGVSWLHVHENALLSVEVSYRRADRPGIGFSHTIESNDDPGQEELAA